MLNSSLTIHHHTSSISFHNPTTYSCLLPKGIILGTTTIPTLFFKRNSIIDHRSGASQSQAFLQLKQLLITSSLFLDFPNDNYPVILTTDASEIGIGGTLQQNINGEIKNLYYHSQVTSSTQRRYDSIELEALVI
ncbi:unnamed protein product [Rotaria sordida]|uniref:Reverse transcriptase/retrotransposon-derived protein RNase H-like domain-containing protein n=2 Tax=Rotaria sordida TaxID=392033 RepID=A0A820BT73_9BILA|nr:unnamed protein product [Rotaria sordida]